jgi:hypothetical protein
MNTPLKWPRTTHLYLLAVLLEKSLVVHVWHCFTVNWLLSNCEFLLQRFQNTRETQSSSVEFVFSSFLQKTRIVAELGVLCN